MSDLTGQSIKNTYGNFLQVDGGVDGSLKPVEDGSGVVSALSLSTTEVEIAGDTTITGDMEITGTFTNNGNTPIFSFGNGTNVLLVNSSFEDCVLTDCVYITPRLSAARLDDQFGNRCMMFPNTTAGLFTTSWVSVFTGVDETGPLITSDNEFDTDNHGIRLENSGTGKVKLGNDTCSGLVLAGSQPLMDGDLNEIVKFVTPASAVNEFTITSSATGNGVSIAATGDDTNINVSFLTKGTGSLSLGSATSAYVMLLGNQSIVDNSANELISFTKTASAVNQVNITNAATTGSPVISVVGDDTNAGLIVQTKGTGALALKSANTTTPIVISSGTSLQHTTNLVIPDTAATRTITLPDADRNLSEVSARAYVSGVASVSSTPIKMPFATENFDIGGYFDSTTNYRFTPLIAGTYRISAQYSTTVSFQSTFTIAIYKNGSLYASTNAFTPFTSSQTVTVQINDLVQLNGSTDYVEIYAFSGSATLATMLTGTTNSFVAISKV